MSGDDSKTCNTALWFTKEQIEAEENAGRFNSPWDERSFRSRILQDWLTMHTLLAAAADATVRINQQRQEAEKREYQLRVELAAAKARITELKAEQLGYDPTQRLPEPGQGVLAHLGTPRRTGLVILKYAPVVDDRYSWCSVWTGRYYRTDEVLRWWPLPELSGGEAR